MDNDTAHCLCPRDEEGEIEMWFIERPNQDGEIIRYYHRYYNANCPKHGWKKHDGPLERPA
jgi:hypothetical protein